MWSLMNKLRLAKKSRLLSLRLLRPTWSPILMPTTKTASLAFLLLVSFGLPQVTWYWGKCNCVFYNFLNKTKLFITSPIQYDPSLACMVVSGWLVMNNFIITYIWKVNYKASKLINLIKSTLGSLVLQLAFLNVKLRSDWKFCVLILCSLTIIIIIIYIKLGNFCCLIL